MKVKSCRDVSPAALGTAVVRAARGGAAVFLQLRRSVPVPVQLINFNGQFKRFLPWAPCYQF